MTISDIQQRIQAIHQEFGEGKRKKIIMPYIKPCNKKAIIQIINSFGPFLGIWILMYFSTKWTLRLTVPLAIINGFFLVRIFIIQHDCGHQSFFGLKNKNLNNAIGVICSMFSTIPYKYWARTHHFHHAHSRELEVRDIGDIDFLTVKEYQQRGRWGRTWYKFFRSPVVLFFFAPIVYLLFINRIPYFSFRGMTRKIKRNQIKNNILLGGLYVALALLIGRKPFLLVQGSIVLAFSIIAFWFFYVQHQHEESYNERQAKWDFLSSAIIGSTYYKLPKVLQRLTGNIGIHHVHHLCSAIPNYNLQKCVDENKQLNKYVTVITFRQSLGCMFNKLRDEDKQQMIGWKTYKKRYEKKQQR